MLLCKCGNSRYIHATSINNRVRSSEGKRQKMTEAVSRLIQQKLEKTKERLEDVDENIRKLTGRNVEMWSRPSGDQRRVSIGGGTGGGGGGVASGLSGRLGPRRGGGRSRGQSGPGRPGRMDTFQRLGVPLKRQNLGSAFSRLGSRVNTREESDEEEDNEAKPTLQSSVVATAPVLKSREDTVKDQQKDKKGQARNKRMFGLLLGTLHKFKQEATVAEDKNVRRAQIEQKLDQKAEEEKKAIASERKELFNERKAKQLEMTKLEELMVLANEQEAWNRHTIELSKFIYTKAKPRIFYLPKLHTPETHKKLQSSKEELMGVIKKRKEDLSKQLEEVETERNKRLERMEKRPEDHREEKENRKGRERRISEGKHRRRRSRESKGKDDERIVSTHDREKRKKDASEDRSNTKRRRTRSRSDDPHRNEKSHVKEDKKKKEESSSKKLGELKEEEVPIPEGVKTEARTGKTGKYESQVHDGKQEGEGNKEEGLAEGSTEDKTAMGGGESTKDGNLEEKESEWIPDVDLSTIQLPEGMGIPALPQKQDQAAAASDTPANEVTAASDFQLGGVDEQLDYNEGIE
ncbi:Pinin [Holothuria leucospilota]|uniref:Pinin n=1 Tax=Holothuria leucospilota TaxID=206669 RepID=A0A9Q1CIQ4_HOLLE|nr:Pinin [Holothuria leucospilota]